MSGNQHEQTPEIRPGETWVDTSSHVLRRVTDNPDNDEIVARTRTTPTRHDGTQRTR